MKLLTVQDVKVIKFGLAVAAFLTVAEVVRAGRWLWRRAKSAW